MISNKQTITVYDLSDRFEGFYIEKHQVEDEIEFYLFHKDCSEEFSIIEGKSYEESEMKYHIWANIEDYIEEFNDYCMDEEDCE